MQVVIERWTLGDTQHSCARCGALDGKEFRQGQGPQPPLHPMCRWVRVVVRVEEVGEPADGAGYG